MPCLSWRALASFASSAAISASMSERMAAMAACSASGREWQLRYASIYVVDAAIRYLPSRLTLEPVRRAEVR